MPGQAGGIPNRTAADRSASSKGKADYGFLYQVKTAIVIQSWKAFIYTVDVGDLSLISISLTLQG